MYLVNTLFVLFFWIWRTPRDGGLKWSDFPWRSQLGQAGMPLQCQVLDVPMYHLRGAKRAGM